MSILASLAFAACSDDFSNYDNRSNKVVVNGAIEVGEQAQLSLTMTMDIHQKIDSSQYLNIVNTLADVKISDGEREEYMVLRRNNNRFPPHYYESQTIRGEAGKTYFLEIRYRGDTLRAQTTIPAEKPDITDIWSQETDNDTLRTIYFRHCAGNQIQYCRNFYKTTADYDFVAATSASYSTQQFTNACNSIALYQKKMTSFLYNQPNSFAIGDTLVLKISAMSLQAFEFWTVYEQEMLNSGNPFLSNARNIPSNIQGGLGIWCGYNSFVRRIIVE
ncbi:MAG: DUF4249 domain-containing protein [Bacteroidetes bacterium]|nr:DUF4249 domain-containing protein [Bacteroidota bacterium]